MSTPGDLAWLRAAIFAELDSDAPVRVSEQEPHRSWLSWLGVRWTTGAAAGVQPVGEFSFNASECFARGILPEVVYSGLVQTWWHPGQSDWVARTRSEILSCYESDQVERPGWELNLDVLERINAYRLQELTPEELLDACRPYCQAGWSPEDQPAMEAWVLLHLDRFRRVQDVVTCLGPFFGATDWCSPQLRMERERAARVAHGEEPPAPALLEEMNLPEGLDWPTARALLGAERLAVLLTQA